MSDFPIQIDANATHLFYRDFFILGPGTANSGDRLQDSVGIKPPKTDRLNQVPLWEFRIGRKSFTPRQLAGILWDFTYLCWANPKRKKRLPTSFGAYLNYRVGRQGFRPLN
jgi:hypothetical protein